METVLVVLTALLRRRKPAVSGKSCPRGEVVAVG